LLQGPLRFVWVPGLVGSGLQRKQVLAARTHMKWPSYSQPRQTV